LFGFGFGKDGHALVWQKKLLWNRCLNMFRLLSARPNKSDMKKKILQHVMGVMDDMSKHSCLQNEYTCMKISDAATMI